MANDARTTPSRIYCKTPSTGTVQNFTFPPLGSLTLPINQWITIARARDFSVPDARQVYADRDPIDITRGIRPGEIFFITPVFVANTDDLATVAVSRKIEVRILLEDAEGGRSEDGRSILCPGKMLVPPGDTAMVPVQGRSLLKRTSTSIVGDQLQIKIYRIGTTETSTSNIYIWASSEEKPSAEHTLETNL
jgi:hypothetical protein